MSNSSNRASIPSDVQLPNGAAESPALSGVTNHPSTPSTTQSQRDSYDRIGAMTLAQLASNEPITPVRLLQPATEEELMDELAMQQNAGADDSEDEEEDEVAEANGLAATAASAEWDRAAHAADDEVMQTFLLDDLFGPPAINLDEVAFDAAVDIPGAPPGWKRPCAPDDWKRAKVRIEKGEPESFDNIDNPGDWDEFVFRPKFQTKKGKDYGRYMYHALPIGATVVAKNELGKRVVGDWEFHYNGYTNTGSQF